MKHRSIGNLIRDVRRKEDVSQEHLSLAIGYKNGQFISNVERGLCGIPHKKIAIIAHELNMNPRLLVDACIEDYRKDIILTVFGGSDEC